MTNSIVLYMYTHEYAYTYTDIRPHLIFIGNSTVSRYTPAWIWLDPKYDTSWTLLVPYTRLEVSQTYSYHIISSIALGCLYHWIHKCNNKYTWPFSYSTCENALAVSILLEVEVKELQNILVPSYVCCIIHYRDIQTGSTECIVPYKIRSCKWTKYTYTG